MLEAYDVCVAFAVFADMMSQHRSQTVTFRVLKSSPQTKLSLFKNSQVSFCLCLFPNGPCIGEQPAPRAGREDLSNYKMGQEEAE